MAKITRYNGDLKAFASNATGTNRTVFGGVTQADDLDSNLNADFLSGWEIVGVNDTPTKQDFNALSYTTSQLLAYLHQMGVAEYNALQEYHIGSVVGNGGNIFISSTDSNIGNVLSDTNNWRWVNTLGEWFESGGVANAYTVSTDINPPFLTEGMNIRFKPLIENTGASTLDAFGLSTLDIKGAGNSSIQAGDITYTSEASVFYRGTDSRSELGTGLAISPFGSMSITALSNSDVAYIDETNSELRTYRFDFVTNTWGELGTGLTISGIGNTGITALNGTDIAFIDGNNDTLRTYRFDFILYTWSELGTGLAIAGVGNQVAITALDSRDIAYIDGDNSELRTYRFNFQTFTWTQFGGSLAIVGVGTTALTTLNSTDITFISNAAVAGLRTYRFNYNSGQWSELGTGLTIASVGTPAISALNGTDAAFIDENNNELRVYRFDFSTNIWAEIGTGLTVTGVGRPALAVLNGTDIAFIDSDNNELRTYRIENPHFELGTLTVDGTGFGAGQTWQDVTGSRLPTVTYTNSTGSPLMVGVVMEDLAGSTSASSLTVDNIIVSQGGVNSEGASPAWHTHSVIIQNGGTYRIDVVSGVPVLLKWAELRI